MAVREHPEHQQLEGVALPDHRLLDLVEDPPGDPADVVELHYLNFSRSATSARSSASEMPGAKRSSGGGLSGESSSHQRPSVSGDGTLPTRSSRARAISRRSGSSRKWRSKLDADPS